MDVYESFGGILINFSGEGNYDQEQDVERVIRYVLRKREYEDRQEELIYWGAFGLPVWENASGIAKAFLDIQRFYSRRGRFIRYLDHEVYSFSPYEEEIIERKRVDIKKLAKKMAWDIYREKYVVLWALHRKAGQYDLHFVTNTVSHMTGRKRRENMRMTKLREARFHAIIQREFQKPFDAEAFFATAEESSFITSAEELERVLSNQ